MVYQYIRIDVLRLYVYTGAMALPVITLRLPQEAIDALDRLAGVAGEIHPCKKGRSSAILYLLAAHQRQSSRAADSPPPGETSAADDKQRRLAAAQAALAKGLAGKGRQA
jgi:hypothetical protein